MARYAPAFRGPPRAVGGVPYLSSGIFREGDGLDNHLHRVSWSAKAVRYSTADGGDARSCDRPPAISTLTMSTLTILLSMSTCGCSCAFIAG